MKGGNAAREAQVLRLLRRKKRPAQIAQSLGLTRQRVYQILGDLAKRGRIERRERDKCQSCGRPTPLRPPCEECGQVLPPPPKVSEGFRRMAQGAGGSPKLGEIGGQSWHGEWEVKEGA